MEIQNQRNEKIYCDGIILFLYHSGISWSHYIYNYFVLFPKRNTNQLWDLHDYLERHLFLKTS